MAKKHTFFSHFIIAGTSMVLLASLATACGGSSESSKGPNKDGVGGDAGAAAGGSDSGGSDSGGSDSGGSDSGGMGGSAGEAGMDAFTIGGTVMGLTGSGLVLQNNAGDDLSLDESGAFVFDGLLEGGDTFDVTIASQPTGQTCMVSGGSGKVGADEVTSVVVNCEDTYTIGGTVSGLDGMGLVLLTGDGDEVSITANGSYAFPVGLETGNGYEVSVKSQPTALSQTCAVANATGSIDEANVNDVDVTCTTNEFTVGVTVTGLLGSGFALQNNAGDDLAIESDGSYTFAAPLVDGSNYEVTVASKPSTPSQTCVVTESSGQLAGADVTDVTVTCTTDTFTVGGTVSGLVGDSVILTNNGEDDLEVSANGEFTFSTPVESGTGYSVEVKTQPGDIHCAVVSGDGTVSTSAVDTVDVHCFVPTDDFDDGDMSPAWVSTGGTYTAVIDPAYAANGSEQGLQLSGSGNHYEGYRYDIPDGCQLSYLSIWIQPDSTESSHRGYLVLGDDNTMSNQGAVWLYAQGNQNRWRLYANSTEDHHVPLVHDQWYHFEFTFDWTGKTVDYFVDGALEADDFPFRHTATTEISQVYIYNYGSATTLYDEFSFECE